MKSFSTAARATAHEKDLPIGPDVEFEYDERKVVATAPTGAQLALFLSAFGDTADMGTRVVDTLNFFTSRFSRDDAGYFKRRLNDPNDSFDFADLAEVLSWLVEEWSGRPTISPSDSASWPTPTGNGSTAGPQDVESTRSAFGLTGS
jgi:hypothetical protein